MVIKWTTLVIGLGLVLVGCGRKSGGPVIVEGIPTSPDGAPPSRDVPPSKVTEEEARQGECMTRMKRVAMAAVMYGQDYDERLAPAERWMDALTPYVRSESTFRCPAVVLSEAYGYAFNRALGSVAMTTIPLPAAEILAYDSENLTRNANDEKTSLPRVPRHHGANSVAYADGHVKAQVPAGQQEL